MILRRLAFVVMFWLAVGGFFGALVLPAVCLLMIACYINAGTQLGNSFRPGTACFREHSTRKIWQTIGGTHCAG